MVMSLTGTLGGDGALWGQAARLAVHEVNAAGGVLPGRDLELVIRDDETNSANAERLARELVEQEGVVAVFGAAASSVSARVLDVTEANRIPQVSCCSTSDTFTTRNAALMAQDRFFFRTAPPDILQSVVVARAATTLMCMRLAILHLDDEYGLPFGLAIEANYEASGGEVAIRVPFVDEQPSYTTELSQIRNANPDCIAVVAYPGSAGVILRDWAALPMAPAVRWIGTDGIKGPAVLAEVGDLALFDGVFGTSPITDPSTPQYQRFADSYRAIFGTAPASFTSNSYDATALIALAIARAGTTDGDAIRDALREVAGPPNDTGGLVRAGDLAAGLEVVREGLDVDYQGASGSTDFDANGDVVTPYEIWRYDQPGSTRPCTDSRVVDPMRDLGSYCRFQVIPPEEI